MDDAVGGEGGEGVGGGVEAGEVDGGGEAGEEFGAVVGGVGGEDRVAGGWGKRGGGGRGFWGEEEAGGEVVFFGWVVFLWNVSVFAVTVWGFFVLDILI